MDLNEIKAIIEAYDASELPIILESHCIVEAVHANAASYDVDGKASSLVDVVDSNRDEVNNILNELEINLTI